VVSAYGLVRTAQPSTLNCRRWRSHRSSSGSAARTRHVSPAAPPTGGPDGTVREPAAIIGRPCPDPRARRATRCAVRTAPLTA